MVYAGDWWSVHAGHELAAIAARAGRAGGEIRYGRTVRSIVGALGARNPIDLLAAAPSAIGIDALGRSGECSTLDRGSLWSFRRLS
jgi:hypothetical protein